MLEAYGSEDKNSFTVRKAVRRRKLWCMLKKYLTSFNEVIQIKEREKMANETKSQILIVNKKSGWCKLKTM